MNSKLSRLWRGVWPPVMTLVLLSSHTLAQNGLRDIPSTKVEDQLSAFKLPEGAKIQLFASEPMLKKPVHMNWDSAGRLWVVSSPLYPHIKPGQEENDQLIVLEDTDGDGTADKSTVFADGLHIPTAVLPGDGGAYVANSTEMLFLRDTDGDGKADHRSIVLSGFGTEDTHHLLHTFRWGPEGMIWMNQSIYIHTHLETPYGVRRLLGGGMWHFRPETQRAEVFMKGLVNSWGHVFDRYGQSFMTDGAGGQGINFVFPQSVFMTSPGASRILSGLNPGQPKHCSLEILGGNHIPEDWRDLLAAPDFRGHRINLFKLSENGTSAYASTQQFDLVSSTHRAFRPIDIKMGPDGAIYIADWYNPIIQHGEVDFRDPRRDHEHGRIWRVSFKDRPLDKPANFKALSDEELARLVEPASWNGQMATVELRMRDKDKAIAAIRSAWEREKSEEGQFRLILASQAVNRFQPDWAAQLADRAASPQIRAGALRALYYEASSHAAAYEAARKAVSDPHPRVRLWAVSVLAQLPHSDTVQIGLDALEGIQNPDDFLDFAVWNLCREHAHKWQPGLAEGVSPFKTPSQLLYAMMAQNTSDGTSLILQAIDRGSFKTGPELSRLGQWAARSGDAATLDRLWRKAIAPNIPASEQATLLAALGDAMKQRKVRPEGDLSAAAGLLASPQTDVYRHAASLAGLWKIDAARPQLEKDFLSSDQTRSDAALEGLRHFSGPQTAQFLGQLAADTARDGSLRARAIDAMTKINPAEAARLASTILSSLEDGNLAGQIFASFLSNNQATNQLAAALQGASLPQTAALAGLQKASSAATKPENLIAAIQKAGRLKPMTMSLNPQEMEAMIQAVAKSNPAEGETIYRRASLQCVVCHAIGGSGGVVGPDLVSIGASAPVDYLIESLLEPGKKIKEGYHTTLVTMKNGDTFAGAVAREDANELVIRDAAGRENRLAKGQIANQTISPVSLMPPGLTLQLRQDEFASLVRFLSELGKEGDFKISARPFLRKWEVLHPHERTRDEIGHYGNKIFAEDFKGYQWTPFYARVDGFLPVAETPEVKGRGKSGFAVWRAPFSAVAPGTLKLSIEGKRSDLSLFLDDEEIPLPENPGASFAVEVPIKTAGSHRLTVAGLKGHGLDQVRIEVVEAGTVNFEK